MTTIAWDGKVLAADRLVSSGDTLVGYEKKLAVFDMTLCVYKGVCAGTGSVDDIAAFIHWIKKGADHINQPTINDEDFMGVAIINGILMEYGRGLHGNRIKYKTAWGGGSDFAIAYMDLVEGGGAVGAVKYAATRHLGTGGEVDSYEVMV